MTQDATNLYWIWKETINRLDTLSRRVAEGRDVMAASEFCRWLNFSGIFKLFDANPQPEPLKVDGAFARWKCEELLRACNDRFRTNSNAPTIGEKEMRSLHEKLDVLAGYVSRLPAPAAAMTSAPENEVSNGQHANSELVVIPGGLDDSVSPGCGRRNGHAAEAHTNGAEALH